MIATRPNAAPATASATTSPKTNRFCDLCTDHVMDRRLVRETRTLTGRHDHPRTHPSSSHPRPRSDARRARHHQAHPTRARAGRLDHHATPRDPRRQQAQLPGLHSLRHRPSGQDRPVKVGHVPRLPRRRARRVMTARAPMKPQTAHDPHTCAVDQRQRPRPLDQEGPPDSLVAVRVGRVGQVPEVAPRHPACRHRRDRREDERSPLRRRKPCPDREGGDRWAQGLGGAA
jgi:hypothetical protein